MTIPELPPDFDDLNIWPTSGVRFEGRSTIILLWYALAADGKSLVPQEQRFEGRDKKAEQELEEWLEEMGDEVYDVWGAIHSYWTEIIPLNFSEEQVTGETND